MVSWPTMPSYRAALAQREAPVAGQRHLWAGTWLSTQVSEWIPAGRADEAA